MDHPPLAPGITLVYITIMMADIFTIIFGVKLVDFFIKTFNHIITVI
jgi:hypothetical protein